MVKSERPRQPRRLKGKWWALLLAIVVQLSFLGVLVFSVQWQNREPVPVSAELYAPPVKAPKVEAPPPPPPPPPKPEPQPAPVPEVTPPPKPQPVVEKPDPHAAEIALKAKQEDERKKKAEAERRETERKQREAKEAEEKRKLEERRQQEARERAQREATALRVQAEREAQLRAQAEREAEVRARQSAEASARSKAEADWIRRIQAKVRGNVIVPSDLAGNPEAIFEVVQLPTGEIIDAKLRKSSGSRAYDEAVQRAILKSSPLPRPDRADLFQRTLTLKFRPQD